MSLRIFTSPVFRASLPHARTAASAHRRAAANGRPPLLKNMPRRIKRPETRQKKWYWKNWWIKHTTPKELTVDQISYLEEVAAETTRRAAADIPAVQRDVDTLAKRLESSLDMSAATILSERQTNQDRRHGGRASGLLYTISRTGTGNLPTYQLTKAGGSLLQTRIRRIEGVATVLKDDLAKWLQPTPPWVRVNTVNGHIEMKGWYKDQVDKYLIARGF